MGRFARRSNAHYVLRLRPGAEAEAALQRTAQTYAEISAWLDAEITKLESAHAPAPDVAQPDQAAGELVHPAQ